MYFYFLDMYMYVIYIRGKSGIMHLATRQEHKPHLGLTIEADQKISIDHPTLHHSHNPIPLG